MHASKESSRFSYAVRVVTRVPIAFCVLAIFRSVRPARGHRAKKIENCVKNISLPRQLIIHLVDFHLLARPTYKSFTESRFIHGQVVVETPPSLTRKTKLLLHEDN